MALTLKAIDSVTIDDKPAPVWTFGGGTALAIDLGHRVSYDIDAFMDSAKLIQSLVPVSNDVTREICWNTASGRADYQYPGHYLKLIVSDVGEIDFLGASSLVEGATTPFEFNGRRVSRECPSEIIAKKIYHRGSIFKARDVFDLAGTFIVMPDELVRASTSPFLTPDIYARVRFRIKARLQALTDELPDEVNPTEFGLSYIENACGLALEALDLMENRPKPARDTSSPIKPGI